jgi:hypothetical protein
MKLHTSNWINKVGAQTTFEETRQVRHLGSTQYGTLCLRLDQDVSAAATNN